VCFPWSCPSDRAWADFCSGGAVRLPFSVSPTLLPLVPAAFPGLVSWAEPGNGQGHLWQSALLYAVRPALALWIAFQTL